jgi:hypothetical protein
MRSGRKETRLRVWNGATAVSLYSDFVQAEDSWDGMDGDSAAFKETVAEPIVELWDCFDFVRGLLDVVLDTHKLDLSG